MRGWGKKPCLSHTGCTWVPVPPLSSLRIAWDTLAVSLVTVAGWNTILTHHEAPPCTWISDCHCTFYLLVQAIRKALASCTTVRYSGANLMQAYQHWKNSTFMHASHNTMYF